MRSVFFLALFSLAPAYADEPAAAPAAAADEAAAEDPGLSKKALLLQEKQARPQKHATTLPARKPGRVLTLHNVHTHEMLPVETAVKVEPRRFNEFARCHHTNQAAGMDSRLVQVVLRAANKFAASTVEVVSAFRAPKYQLMLRKKGREVARDSQHPRGTAIDFRIPSVTTKKLLRYIKSMRIGGVGYYPHSSFVHADTGRIRFWKGN